MSDELHPVLSATNPNRDADAQLFIQHTVLKTQIDAVTHEMSTLAQRKAELEASLAEVAAKLEEAAQKL
jgi:predicted  nucleic acid-binding Zn-ribbon protein